MEESKHEMDRHLLSDKEEDLLKRARFAEERVKILELELQRFGDYQKETQQLQVENAILRGRVEKMTNEIEVKNYRIDELYKKWQDSSIHSTLKENQELSSKLM